LLWQTGLRWKSFFSGLSSGFAGGRGGKPGEEGKRDETVRVHGRDEKREFILIVPAAGVIMNAY